MRARQLACVLLACVGFAGAAAGEGVGVAPFEVVPAGAKTPDVALLVAQRLATRGVGRVVGPAEVGAPARFEPLASDAQGWARTLSVDAIVVGRTTRVGSQLSVHAKLIDGPTGKVVGAPVVGEAARPEELGRVIDHLTGALVDRLGERPGAVSSAGPALASPKQAPEPAPKERMGASFDRGTPLSIKSDSLDAAPDGKGGRRFVFTGNVRAVQGELSLVADRVEALSAAGASEPERLTARGHVTIRQGTRVARCAEAIFYRREERVVCTGQLAEIEQGCDRVRGPKIIFHLGSERVEGEGGMEVQIRPEAPGCGVAATGGGAPR